MDPHSRPDENAVNAEYIKLNGAICPCAACSMTNFKIEQMGIPPCGYASCMINGQLQPTIHLGNSA